MRRSAELSACGRYRYSLRRSWELEDGRDRRVCWVMLNPSTANAEQDDPTIRRCIGFSDRWGHNAIEVVNLFAWRATKPADLLKAMCDGEDVVGPENDAFISQAAERAALIVVAWGTDGGTWEGFQQRVPRWKRVLDLLTDQCAIARNMGGRAVHALRLTKDGHPSHPLYVKYGEPILFVAAAQPVQPTPREQP